MSWNTGISGTGPTARTTATSSIKLNHSRFVMQVRPGTDTAKREEIAEAWYRDQLRKTLPPFIAKWEPIVAAKVKRFFVQRMKTRWGSCNPRSGHIRLNTDLAKKTPECLEYIVVHEMTHMLEPTHNGQLISLMDGFMPQWRILRDRLNRLPVKHEHWKY
jgi:predicted metal-dependent hydrolase